jgi:hypothetical protein
MAATTRELAILNPDSREELNWSFEVKTLESSAAFLGLPVENIVLDLPVFQPEVMEQAECQFVQ